MIDVDPTLGPYCTQQRLDFYVEIAKQLEARTPGIGPIKVYYDPKIDFVCIAFDLEGHHYYLEGYKLITIQRDDRKNDKYYCRYDHDVIDFFCGNYFHGPDSPLPANPKYKKWQPKLEIWESLATPEELDKARNDPDNYRIIPRRT